MTEENEQPRLGYGAGRALPARRAGHRGHVGVQWHPELLVSAKPQQRLFEALAAPTHAVLEPAAQRIVEAADLRHPRGGAR
jgi:hypothetical protein